MVTTMIDHASADLWIMPRGTKCFEDPSLLDERERFRALSIKGVAEADAGRDRVCGMADADRRDDAGLRRRLRTARRRTAARGTWSPAASRRCRFPTPSRSINPISTGSGSTGLGATAEIRDQKVEVRAVTKGIRSFTTTPYVFTVARPGARLYRDSGEQGHLFSRARRPQCGCRRPFAPSCGPACPTSRF